MQHGTHKRRVGGRSPRQKNKRVMRDQIDDPLLKVRPEMERSAPLEAIPVKTTAPLSVNHGVNLALLSRFCKILWKMKVYHPIQILLFVLIVVAWLIFSLVAQFSIVLPNLFAMAIANSQWVSALIYIALLGITAVVYVALNSLVQLFYGFMKWNWRWNLTDAMIKSYLKNKNYYDLLFFKESSVDNPDQRITADVVQFVDKMAVVLDLVTQHFPRIVLTVMFLLYEGAHWSIFVFPVISPIVIVVGNALLSMPVTMTLYRKNEAEGTFRYYHARIREHAETTCFFGGEKTEKSNTKKIFDRLVKFSYYLVLFSFLLLSWCYMISYMPTISNLFVIGMMVYWNIPPFNPEMSSPQISLVMKETFDRMNMASISVISLLNVGPDLGILFGTVHRIGVFLDACDALSKKSDASFGIKSKNKSIGTIVDNENKIAFRNVDIITPNGVQLFSKVSLEVSQGEDLLIMGPSGSGKSSILRILSGLWELPNGTLEKPSKIGREGIFYMPQKPYLIKGDLKMQIMYPFSDHELLKNPRYNPNHQSIQKNATALSEDHIIELLEMCNLKYLLNHIDTNDKNGKKNSRKMKEIEKRNLLSEDKSAANIEKSKVSDHGDKRVLTNVKIQWDKELSLGEQQRLAFCRLFFHRPKFAILDEATSALDQENEENLHKVCQELGITLLSVAHRPSCKAYHKNLLQLNGDGEWKLRGITEHEKKEYKKPHWEIINEFKETTTKLKRDNLANSEDPDSFLYLFKEDYANQSGLGNKNRTGLFKKSFLRHFKNVISAIFCDNCSNCKGVLLKIWLPFAIIVIFSVFVGFLQLFAAVILPYSLIPFIQARSILFFVMFVVVAVLMLVFAFLDGARQAIAGIVGIMTRARLTRKIHASYFSHKVYYKASHLDQEIDNPDQRITVDAATLTGFDEPGIVYIFATFCYKISAALVNLVYTTIVFPVAPIFSIVFVAIFSVPQLILMAIITNATFQQEKKEGYFRFSLARLKEYSEQIALYRGVSAESSIILENFRSVMYNQLTLIIKEWALATYQLIMAGTGQYLAIFLMLVMGPVLVTVGGLNPDNAIQVLMSLCSSVTTSLFSLVDLTKLSLDIAKNFGAMNRVGQMMEHMKILRNSFESAPGSVSFQQAEDESSNSLIHGEQKFGFSGSQHKDSLLIQKLNVKTPDGERTLLENLNLEVKHGQNLLINGRSGCGKSSLLRVIGQLWPTTEGRIIFKVEQLKQNLGVMGFGEQLQQNGYFFVPQKPYCVLGTFKEMLTYPDKTTTKSDKELLNILDCVKLAHIFNRIDQNWDLVKDWATFFSPGEQQRISFARILVQKPKFVILDEATASLDLENEEIMYSLCKKHGISCISVGHRETLNDYHDLLLSYEQFEGWTLKRKQDATPF